MKTKLLVACTNASGAPDFFKCDVEASESDIEDGHHYSLAKAMAEERGYEGPMVCFDEQDLSPELKTFLIENNHAGLHVGRRLTACINTFPDTKNLVNLRADIHEIEKKSPSHIRFTVDQDLISSISNATKICKNFGYESIALRARDVFWEPSLSNNDLSQDEFLHVTSDGFFFSVKPKHGLYDIQSNKINFDYFLTSIENTSDSNSLLILDEDSQILEDFSNTQILEQFKDLIFTIQDAWCYIHSNGDDQLKDQWSQLMRSYSDFVGIPSQPSRQGNQELYGALLDGKSCVFNSCSIDSLRKKYERVIEQHASLALSGRKTAKTKLSDNGSHDAQP